MKQVIILLTGTVNPGKMSFTKLLDPDTRRRQYVDSIKFWLEKTSLRIVFIENSETDISTDIDAKYLERVEFLTFKGNDSSDRGKGYGEFNCLRYAAQYSSFYKNSDFVFKITGRLKVLNFKNFYNYYLENTETFIFVDLQKMLRIADSRIFGFHPDFLSKYLLKRQEELDDKEGRIFEFVLAKATLEALLCGEHFSQFSRYPELVGVSGTAGQSYRSGFFYFSAKHIQISLKKFLMGMSTVK